MVEIPTLNFVMIHTWTSLERPAPFCILHGESTQGSSFLISLYLSLMFWVSLFETIKLDLTDLWGSLVTLFYYKSAVVRDGFFEQDHRIGIDEFIDFFSEITRDCSNENQWKLTTKFLHCIEIINIYITQSEPGSQEINSYKEWCINTVGRQVKNMEGGYDTNSIAPSSMIYVHLFGNSSPKWVVYTCRADLAYGTGIWISVNGWLSRYG